MSTMDNIKDRASDAAQSAAKTAKYVAFVAKKRVAILAEQEKIHRNYARLGKVYYKDYVTDEEPDEAEYSPLCDAITESFRRINEMKQEIDDAKAAYSGEPCEEAEAELLAITESVEEEADAATEAAEE